jgi:Ribbon-helix-helix protein, copG family
MYNDDVSVKYQITLPDDLAGELKQAAAKLNVPLAEFIRETMETRLRSAKQKRKSENTHPLSSIIGLMDGEDADLASRVDEILYR